MIDITAVYKTFEQSGQQIIALDGVSLHVEAGEIYGVVGVSGAGKSTLIRCVNLLERPTSGTIRINGEEITSLSSAELRLARRNIGMIFQHFNLLSSRAVAGNVAFPLEIVGYPKKDRGRRVQEMLELVSLSDKANAYPAQLSGGQKQRVGIARALAIQPKVLLSDEATSALDPQNTDAILGLLHDLNRRLGLTILLITHEMSVVKQICDRVAVLEAGRIIEQGPVYELAANPESLISKALFPPAAQSAVSPDSTVVTITFVGKAADGPILTKLARQFDVEINILSGSIQQIGGQSLGRLQVALSGSQVDQALDYLRYLDLKLEFH